MGKFILCNGVQTKHPFRFELTETNVYSIEELCYHIYNNIYAIAEEDFNFKLVEWLREEVKMAEISEKLLYILENKQHNRAAKNYLKDIVVSLLCSADYYTEAEILSLIEVMDSIYNLSPIYKRKIKGDNCLKYKNYSMAAQIYEEVLRSQEAADLSPEEYGDILHNQAIAYLHTVSFQEAAKRFQEAFSRNHKEESLFAYLLTLKLGRFDTAWEKELSNFSVSEEKKKEYLSRLKKAEKKARSLPLYKNLQKIKELKINGQVSEYYQEIDTILYNWKQNYRHESR